ncbi:hypothetical protein NMY22_g451 [Coprinellus aureogranulatus]|nr:hypothetical protein NMY22_g451 [Coprinellus aureogranulatus]
MVPQLAIEIYDMILKQYVADSSLCDEFDPRTTPFNEALPPYPSARADLANICTLVSKTFSELAAPLVWEYIVVRCKEDLELLIKLIDDGVSPKTRQPIRNYTRRVDFRSWRRVSIDRSMDLLSRLPDVQVLAVECNDDPRPLWRHTSNKIFFDTLPAMCPNLRRLQLLDPRESPNILEVAHLSRKCLHLRALHVVNLSERYRPYVTAPADDIGDGTEGEGDEGQGADSDAEWESGDWYEEVDDDDDDEEDDEEDNYQPTESSTMTVAPSSAEGDVSEEEQLVFDFHKLKYLALGMGHVHGLISERRSIGTLVEALEPYRERMQSLCSVNVNVPLDGIKSPLLKFNSKVESSVLHMYYRSYPRNYVLFSNIRRLVVVVHTTYISVPLDLNLLEEFEILLRRPVYDRYNHLGGRAARRMIRTARVLLDVLLQDRYPLLKSVVLWKGAAVHNAGIDELVSRYVKSFKALNITLCEKTRFHMDACDSAFIQETNDGSE